jgi:hypothetical protein
LFRVEDRTFGDRPNIAVGVGVDLSRRVHIEFEVNDTMGLTPEPVRSGAPPVRVAVTRKLSLRPDFRLYDSTIQSRVNLNLLRGLWQWHTDGELTRPLRGKPT